MTDVCVVGAGGHSRSLLGLLRRCGLVVFGLYDDSYNIGQPEEIMGVKLRGLVQDIPVGSKIILAVGDNLLREGLFSKYRDSIHQPTLVDPTATVEPDAVFGDSNQIFAKAYLNSCVSLGDNNIINTNSILEHEVRMGSGNHISVGTIICGRVVLGNRCFVGAGSVIKDRIEICDDVIIGAGAVVVDHIEHRGVYVGCPARRLK